MGKKVLILSASPRKGGNSELLCDSFARGAEEAGHTVHKVFLGDCKINYCTGCGACFNTHRCVQKDNMKDILAEIIDADVIVMATPVYFYAMNAQMKTLIDRTVPRYQEIADKDFYFILAAADSDEGMMRRAIEGFRGFTEDCLPNAREKGIIYGLNAWKIGEIQNSPAMEQAYQMGKGV